MRPAALAAVSALVVAAVAGGCSSSTRNLHGRIAVVAAENFWGEVAAQVGGARVDVSSIIDGTQSDPHLYDSDARDAEALASARLVVENGLGYDAFVDKLLATTSGHDRIVVTAADVQPAVSRHANPHLWYDFDRVRAVAAAIERALAKIQPAHASDFAANRVRFDRSLQRVTGVVAVIRQRFLRAPVAYTERVPEYLLLAAGLDVRTPPGFARAIEGGNEPSAADTQRMRDLISKRQIQVLLYNSQATSAVTRQVRSDAQMAGVPVVAVTETMPRHIEAPADYVDWQYHQATSLLNALEEAGRRGL